MKIGKTPRTALNRAGSLQVLEPSGSLVHLYDLIGILLLQPHLMIEIRLYIKGVLFVIIRGKFIKRVLCQVILVREERPNASELQDTFAAIKDGKLINGGKLVPSLLIIHVVRLRAAPALPGVEHINGFFAERGTQLFQRGRLRTAKEYTGIHVADDGVRVILIDRFQLTLRLKHQAGRDLTASDGSHQLLQIGDLPDVRALINEAAHMNREPSAVNIIRFLTQQVEQLRVDHGNQEIKGAVRITHDKEQRRPLVSKGVQLQFIIGRDLPKLRDIEWCKPCAA